MPAVAEPDGFDEVFRPHAVSRPRPLSSLEEVAGLSCPELDDDELPMLRTRRRVPVKRGRLPRGRLSRVLLAAGLITVVCLLVMACVAVHSFFMQDGRFRIEAASSIQVLGNSQVTRPELLSVFGEDIGRNLFHVPLAARRTELEQLPWVEHATVMRLLPNQLRVAVIERVPVAFVRAGNHIGLVDKHGVLLDMPPAMMAAKHYSFPVVTGITAAQSGEDRAARMRLYGEFMTALGDTAPNNAAAGNTVDQLSEVDLSDPEDVRVLLPSAGSDLLVHFGSDDFAARWDRLQQKLPGWRQQYPRLAGVDLRYQRQTVLEMAKPAVEDTPPAGAPPHAVAGPVPAHKPVAKPAARVGRVGQHIQPSGKPSSPHAVAKKPAAARTSAQTSAHAAVQKGAKS